MIQTIRFTFQSDPSLYPSVGINYRHKCYFGVVVVDFNGPDSREVISTTVIGIAPAQERVYRNQGCLRLVPAEVPWLKEILVTHFQRDQERLHAVLTKEKQWPAFHNGAGIRGNDEMPEPLRPFLVQ